MAEPASAGFFARVARAFMPGRSRGPAESGRDIIPLMSDLPVACSLPAPELREREATVLAKIRARVQEVKDLDSGYALRFDPEEALLADLATLIDLERQCCPFLRFGLEVLPANGPIWLELTGPEGTRELLRTVLNLP